MMVVLEGSLHNALSSRGHCKSFAAGPACMPCQFLELFGAILWKPCHFHLLGLILWYRADVVQLLQRRLRIRFGWEMGFLSHSFSLKNLLRLAAAGFLEASFLYFLQGCFSCSGIL